MIYLDHNATTPLSGEVLEAMMPYFKQSFGNASSFYEPARTARAALEKARGTIAAAIGASPEEIVFTGSGTESDNLALRGVCRAFQGKDLHIITSPVEHHAVLKTCEDLQGTGVRITQVPVDNSGCVDPADVAGNITPDTVIITIMCANNETGVIQPIQAISEIARGKGIIFHTDAVQAFGKMPVHVDELGVDLMTISAHKIYGPKGVGALYIRKGTNISPIITGGSQERARRAGTENIPAIAGFAKAVEMAVEHLDEAGRHMTVLRDTFENQIMERIDNVTINGQGAPRIPNTSSMSFASIDGESILLHLDLLGVCASTGSACATGSPEPSHVLTAMGLSHVEAQGTIRFSLGKDTTLQDIDRLCEVMPGIVSRLRRISSI
ncbi:MAG TPA: cysteine desulfurase family protein [Deltaproteobacteria bacterium]|nr:cysteine desulfurase family protein [Deltaproteobacteria bacterium]